MGEASESHHLTPLPPGGAARVWPINTHTDGACEDRCLDREKCPFRSPGPSLQNGGAGGERPAARNAVAAGRTARAQVFSPPVLQPGGSWGKPRSGLKGYSSVGRVAVSKTAGRGFESLCPCQARQIRRTRLRRSVTAGKPVPSRSPPALVARRRYLPDLPALLPRHQRGRDRRSAGDHPEASLYCRPRRGSDLDIALLQVADERFRL
jgi:hypothetical protein